MQLIELSNLKDFFNRKISKDKALPGFKTVWIYKKKCITLEFEYENIEFSFDIIPTQNSEISIDLIQRKPVDGKYTTNNGLQIFRIAQQTSIKNGLSIIKIEVEKFIERVDNHLKTIKQEKKPPEAMLSESKCLFAPTIYLSLSDYLDRIQLQKQHLEHLVAKGDINSTFRKKITTILEELFLNLNFFYGPELTIEVGAHEATFSHRIKNQLQQTTALAFEANPVVFNKHRAKAIKNNIEYINLAVSNKSGEITLRVPMDSEGKEANSMGSIHDYIDSTEFIEYQVKSITLDQLIKKTIKNSMWIDVEGATLEVLEGAKTLLNNTMFLYSELEEEGRWSSQANLKKVSKLLYKYGLVPIFTDIQRIQWQSNIFFIRESELNNPNLAFLLSNYYTKLKELESSSARKE